MSNGKRSLRRWGAWAIVAALALGLGSAAWWQYRNRPVSADSGIPTASARQGEFLVIISCRGELVAGKSVQITAPVNVPNLQIVWLATPGSPVKPGDPIVKFDASGAKRQLAEKEASLKQAEASLAQAEAEARIKFQQDTLDLAGLEHDVERAELETRKAEILGALQAEENRISLSLAKEKVKVQKATLALNKASSASKVASLKSQRDKTQAEVDLTKKRLSQMELLAPSEGIVTFLMNFSQGWVNAKPFKVGDNVWAGSAIAEIPDLRTLQMKAKVEEIERGKLKDQQSVRIVLDPFPEKPFDGQLRTVSTLTEQNFEWPPSRNFRAYATFAEVDNRLRPAMNGRLDVVVDRLKDAISVPAKAVFARDGRPVVLVPSRDGLKPMPVEVLARNPDEVAVSGIGSGTIVALLDEAGLKEKKGAGKQP